jgi:zinc transport system permease protein
MMILATLFSAIFSLSGLELSYRLNWPPGATIALIAAVFYLLLLLLKGKSLVNKQILKGKG